MTANLETALAAVRLVADRSDPTEPMQVGTVADALAIGRSAASRLCGALEAVGLLERSGGYGAYRIGRAAVALSGSAAASVARAVRLELARASLQTGETVCVAAAAGTVPRIVAAVESPWTLHAPAAVGEAVTDDAGAIAIALAIDDLGAIAPDGRSVDAAVGRRVEVATPVLGPCGDRVAVLAVRMPAYRSARGVPVARRVLRDARAGIERALAAVPRPVEPARAVAAPPAPLADGASSLEAALAILTHLAVAPDGRAGIAAATGLRPDRVRRLLALCRAADLVVGDADGLVGIAWSVHAWHRAAAHPTLAADAAAMVADAAESTGTCAFLTVLHGLRSHTLVEHLEVLGDGIEMRPWVGRTHPIVGSDGGPTMVLDIDVEQLADLFPERVAAHERRRFLEQVERVARDGVLTIESPDEIGITSISAPVRDASGTVAAAACLVGASERVGPQRAALEQQAVALAERVSALLR